MLKIICYGGGAGFNDFYFHLRQDRCTIVGIIDKSSRGGDKYPIVSLEDIFEMKYDYIVICSRKYRDEMIDALLAHNVPKEKIIVNYNCLPLRLEYHNPEFTEKEMGPRCLTGNLVWGPKLPYRSFDAFDYVRKATLALVGDMLKKYQVPGALAELGVLRGVFSSLMSELFPEKEIWLFDTFGESFLRDDNMDARLFGRGRGIRTKNSKIQKYESKRVNVGEKQVSLAQKEAKDLAQMMPLFKGEVEVEAVLGNMPYPEKCIVRKGLFPDTTEGIPGDVKFSLVSIDTDFYQSILDGLEFFYPRMSHGGILMVHDYFTHEGVALAVDEFCKKQSLIPVPVADHDGTIILTA